MANSNPTHFQGDFLESLDTVWQLATLNCLDNENDPDDPDTDYEIAQECHRQRNALNAVQEYLDICTAAISMNRYELENAINDIDGYFLPRPHEDGNKREIEAFNRAKAEVLKNLERKMACIASVSVEQFYQAKKRVMPV